MNENPTTNVPGPAALDMMVRIVMSQTDMAHHEVMSALERTQYNVKQVIREYMRSGHVAASAAAAASSSKATVSTNQLRFSEIRNFMDNSAETFRRNQEMTRIYQEVMEKKKQQAEAEAATAQQQQQQQQQQRSKL